MIRIISIGAALFVVVVGGFFSLGLWSAGFSYGRWGPGSFLGIVMFSLSVGVGAIVFLLGRLVEKEHK